MHYAQKLHSSTNPRILYFAMPSFVHTMCSIECTSTECTGKCKMTQANLDFIAVNKNVFKRRRPHIRMHTHIEHGTQ